MGAPEASRGLSRCSADPEASQEEELQTLVPRLCEKKSHIVINSELLVILGVFDCFGRVIWSTDHEGAFDKSTPFFRVQL